MGFYINFNRVEINTEGDIERYDCGFKYDVGNGLITEAQYNKLERYGYIQDGKILLSKFCQLFDAESIINISLLKEYDGDLILVDVNEYQPSFKINLENGELETTLDFTDSKKASLSKTYTDIKELHEDYGNVFYLIDVNLKILLDYEYLETIKEELKRGWII